jgi:predicted nucleotidyltransferase
MESGEMNFKDLAEQNLIYKVRVGSHAYGTAISTSDFDYAGIFIPPVEFYFGLQSFDLLSEQTEEDRSYYSLRKYANLAVANNPNVLELLFVDQSDICLSTPAADELLDIRAGKWTYEEITNYADEMVAKIDSIQPGRFKVPIVPNTEGLNKVVVGVTRDYLEGYHGDRT